MELPADGQSISIAKSANNLDIELYRFGSGSLPLLLLGGVHGDESEGYLLAERFIEGMQKGEYQIPDETTLYVCPRANPDGCAADRRTNHRNVDLNRNLPTADWNGEFTNVRYYPGATGGSEVESEATLKMIQTIRPAAIISLHSYINPMINFNGDCENWARAMSEKNDLPPKGDIGYPTPGSLGTYTGWERNIPTITLEILRGEEPTQVWENHRDALLLGISYYVEHPLPRLKEGAFTTN